MQAWNSHIDCDNKWTWRLKFIRSQGGPTTTYSDGRSGTLYPCPGTSTWIQTVRSRIRVIRGLSTNVWYIVSASQPQNRITSPLIQADFSPRAFSLVTGSYSMRSSGFSCQTGSCWEIYSRITCHTTVWAGETPVLGCITSGRFLVRMFTR